MKHNRFSEMVPPTPEDFHAGILDALNRLPSQRRWRMSHGAMRIAASVAVVLAFGALLPLAIRLRPSPEDRVMSPDGSLLSNVAPQTEESGLRLEIGDWSVDASGVSLDWSIVGPEDETLLVRAQASVTVGGEQMSSFGVDLMELYYALLGRDVLDSGNGAKLTRSERETWQNASETTQVEVTARVCVYRPIAGFIDDRQQRPESFEGTPKWLLGQYDEYVGAQPIDYYGRYDYQTPFGCDGMDAVLSAFESDFFNGEAVLNVADRMELERILLETLGYAKLVDSWEVVVDMSAGSGSGATEIRRIER